MGDNPPSEKVFIGDIPAGADETLVRTIFSAYGAVVDVKVFPPRGSDLKGAALVKFESVDSARWLVENVNGNIPQGMIEPVYVAYAKNSKGGGGGGGKGQLPLDYGKQLLGLAQAALSAPYGGLALGAAALALGGAKGGGVSGSSAPCEKIFVGDIPVGFDESMLRQTMSNYGTVTDIKMLPARAPGEKSAALIRFSTVAEATFMVEHVNGNIPAGMTEPVFVSFARQQAPSAPKGCVGGKGAVIGNDMGMIVKGIHKAGVLPGSGPTADENCILVTGLPLNTTDLDLYRLFSPMGALAVDGVKAMVDESGRCLGSGYVDYVEPTGAALAISTLNGTVLPDGTMMNVIQRTVRSS